MRQGAIAKIQTVLSLPLPMSQSHHETGYEPSSSEAANVAVNHNRSRNDFLTDHLNE